MSTTRSDLFKNQTVTTQQTKTGLKFKFIEGAICTHCHNGGWISLDHDLTAAPCPMCNLGGVIDTQGFWAVGNPTRFTWNNGLTIRHTTQCEVKQETGPFKGNRCRVAAHREAGVCEWHSKPDEVRFAVYKKSKHLKPQMNVTADRKQKRMSR